MEQNHLTGSPHPAASSGESSSSPSQVRLQRRDTDLVADRVGLPYSIAEPALVTYRSVGIGVFGVVTRFSGMPLEKIALYMNSSQVSGRGQLQQAIKLTFRQGLLAPYRVVGKASVVAWFFQYSVMGAAFQTFDHSLSRMFNVKPVYYGHELMQPPVQEDSSTGYRLKYMFKTALSPVLAAALETQVSNRAEVQRFFGREKFALIEQNVRASPFRQLGGPAFAPCMMRNFIMCNTTFILTPTVYKLYFPQEKKNKSSLFWFGLGMNIFFGNVVAITQQALWGRSLDYLAKHGHINYTNVIREGLAKEGMSAFFTLPRWFSRVLMNCPAQGVLPWFYNEILPLGEYAYLSAVKVGIYQPFLEEIESLKEVHIERTLSTRVTLTNQSDCAPISTPATR